MSNVPLPCDYEDDWREYKKLFILLSHLRSINELHLLISSHTREDSPPGPIYNTLKALKGLLAYLTGYCSPEEQESFMKGILGLIARSAAMLEERVPSTGIPFLESQENSAVVLGRKVILSFLSNAFLCTFPCRDNYAFNFTQFFAVFLDDDMELKKIQADKLRAILVYFDCVATKKCSLSGVITYRRQVLGMLPKLSDWECCNLPLHPLGVIDEGTIQESGGHTLQVCYTGKPLGGGVLEKGGCSEEIRFLSCPELLITRLVMAELADNEAIIVTGAERFSSFTGSGSTLKFAGEFFDDSECDVFGNFKNSLVTLDFHFPNQKKEQEAGDDEGGAENVVEEEEISPYHPNSLLRGINKAYVGFFCQQDRGDISTELLAMSVKRGSLAFVAEDYPECGAPLNVVSRQSDLGNVHLPSEGFNARPQFKISVPPPPLELIDPSHSQGASVPLSPIEELAESPNFPGSLASSILKASMEEMAEKEAEIGGIEGFAANQSGSSVDHSKGSSFQPETLDNLATLVTGSILEDIKGLCEPPPPPKDEKDEDTEEVDIIEKFAASLTSSIIAGETAGNRNLPFTPDSLPSGPTEAYINIKSYLIAKNITEDVLSDASPVRSLDNSSDNGLISIYASNLSDVIIEDAVKSITAPPKTTSPPSPQPPSIYVEPERKISAESGLSSFSSGQNVAVCDFSDDIAGEAVREGINIAEYLSREQGSSSVDELAQDIVSKSIQGSLPGQPQPKKDRDVPPSDRPPIPVLPYKQPPSLSRQGLTLAATNSDAGEGELETPPLALSHGSSSNLRLLTPASSRYAWSTASTRDEDSRPVSPTDMDHIGLTLTNDSDEFSSLFSKMVINHAITNITGETLSPRTLYTGEDDATQDFTSLPSSSKVGMYLSKLVEAEAPLEAAGIANSSWQKMRTQLLRPVATGSDGCKDYPHLQALIQWIASSGSGRPRLFYYTSKNDGMDQLLKVSAHLTTKQCTVGQLLCLIVAYYRLTQQEQQECDLFNFILKA